MSPFQAAIHAARNAHRWGTFAAARYAMNNGANLITWLTALKFEQRRRIRNGGMA